MNGEAGGNKDVGLTLEAKQEEGLDDWNKQLNLVSYAGDVSQTPNMGQQLQHLLPQTSQLPLSGLSSTNINIQNTLGQHAVTPEFSMTRGRQLTQQYLQPLMHQQQPQLQAAILTCPAALSDADSFPTAPQSLVTSTPTSTLITLGSSAPAVVAPLDMQSLQLPPSFPDVQQSVFSSPSQLPPLSSVEPQLLVQSKNSAVNPFIPGDISIACEQQQQQRAIASLQRSQTSLRSGNFALVKETSQLGVSPSHQTHSCSEDREKLTIFVKTFRKRRKELGFSQEEVALALGKMYGSKYSKSRLSILRFEALRFGFHSMCKLKLLLERWLNDVNNMDAGKAFQTAEGKVLYLNNLRLKSTKRTIIEAPVKKSLEESFLQNPYPSSEKISTLASKHGMEEVGVRIWFKNRRHKQRQMNYSSNTLPSPLSKVSTINPFYPPSVASGLSKGQNMLPMDYSPRQVVPSVSGDHVVDRAVSLAGTSSVWGKLESSHLQQGRSTLHPTHSLPSRLSAMDILPLVLPLPGQ